MRKLAIIAMFVGGLALSGCAKASKEDCTKAIANLKSKGLMGSLMAKQLEKDDMCEKKLSPAEAKCLAGLKKVTKTTLEGC